MENLIKNVEDFRTHVRIVNFLSYFIFFIFAVNSFIELGGKDGLGEEIYLGYLIALMIFLCFYFFKNRRNLPFPTEITKESMEQYQLKQLKRYLSSMGSIVWWGVLPISQGYLGVVVINSFEGDLDYIGLIVIASILIWAFVQSRIFFKRYFKQYEELGGRSIDLWYTF